MNKIFLICMYLLMVLVPPGWVHAQGVSSGVSFMAQGISHPGNSAYFPAVIKGLSFDPRDPLRFRFIVNTGDSGLMGQDLEAESRKLIKYFLAGLTTPEKDFWVNLSPYEENRIIPESFGVTDMGRDLLEQDYVLKQMMSSLMSPDQDLGKEFWGRVHERSARLYGTTDIPLNTFNKVWIVPQKATLFEKDGQVFVVHTHLKVMLEEDFLSQEKTLDVSPDLKDAGVMNGVTSGVVRDVLIPELERDVNEGRNFAVLRQIYNSMVLAVWFKQNLRASLLGQVYVDQNKTPGIEITDENDKSKIYEQYVEAFHKGAYNFITEEVDSVTGDMIPRKYFSGGFGVESGNDWAQIIEVVHAVSPENFLRLRKNLEDGRGQNVVVDAAMASTVGYAGLSPRASGGYWARAAMVGVFLALANPLSLQAQMATEVTASPSTASLSPQELAALENDVSHLYYRNIAEIQDKPQFKYILSLGSRAFPFLLGKVLRKELTGDQLRWAAYLAVRLAPDQRTAEELKRFIEENAYPWYVSTEASSGLESWMRQDIRNKLQEQVQHFSSKKEMRLTAEETAVLRKNVVSLKGNNFKDVKISQSYRQIVALGSRAFPVLAQMLLDQERLPDSSLKWSVRLAVDAAPDILVAEKMIDYINSKYFTSDVKLEANTALQERKTREEDKRLLSQIQDKGQRADQASLADPLGGINLDPSLWEMSIERDGKGVPLPLTQQDPSMMSLPGLVPIIISITPSLGLLSSLGLEDELPSKPVVASDLSELRGLPVRDRIGS